MKLNKSNYFCSNTFCNKINVNHKHYYKIIKKNARIYVYFNSISE